MRSMQSLVAVGMALVLAVGIGRAEDVEPIDVDAVTPAQREAMCAYLKQAGKTPVQYVQGKFAEHDLVILGETHQVYETCRLVSDLVEPLYQRAGVRLLLTEFVRNRNSERLHELLTAETWDAEAVHDVMRDWAWPTWGFAEYRDILHAAWKVNRARPEGTAPFRVVGLDNDWNQYAYAWSGLSRKDKFENRMAREEHLVAVAEREAFAAKQKALVHIGFSHSLTGHGIRFGTVLTKNHGDRVFQVVMHSKLPARGGVAPLTGLLESIWVEAGSQPVGFDVVGSPLGMLRDRSCVFWNYLKNGRFQEMAQGYVLLAPVDALHKTTWIPGFINEAQFERARKVAVAARMAKEDEFDSAETLDACLQRLFPARDAE